MPWATIIRKAPQGRAADVNGVLRFTGETAEFPDRVLMIRPTWFAAADPPKPKRRRKKKVEPEAETETTTTTEDGTA